VVAGLVFFSVFMFCWFLVKTSVFPMLPCVPVQLVKETK
jgi:hypothetical protein